MRKAIYVNGSEIGYILYNMYVSKSRTLYINQIMVHPYFRRKGYFKLMIKEIREIAKTLGCPTMTLSVGSMDETEDFLFSLYERYGFHKTTGNWMQATT